MKRLLDIVVSLAGLVMLSPLLLLIAVLVKVTSPGPVFYSGTRTGRYGKPFQIMKFRSMVVNAESIGGTSTSDNDARVTQVGRYLRRYKLDELPQLINVLLGDMSLVGPRPEVAEYTSLYDEDEIHILDVRPGITDYASIKFRNLGTLLAQSDDPDLYYRDFIRPEKNRLRLEYVRTQSFFGDIKLILETIKAVLFS